VERGRDQVDVAVTVDWHEKLRMLKIVFPTSLHFPKAQFEVSFGSIERPVDGNEVSGQAWIDISGVYRPSDQIVGLGVLNDAKYSFSAVGNEIALTVLRSPIYAHHDPFVPDPKGDYNFIDQGLQRFRYSLVPHTGSWERGNLTRRALELNAPAIPIIETYHDGPLPAVASFLEVDVLNVTVTAVKIAEDGDDLIVRAFETDKVATHATFRLPFWNRSFEADFRRCEIKTFRIPRDPERPIVEVNLLEEEA
jgi:alpha-mannosidase